MVLDGDSLLIGAYRDDVSATDQGSIYEFGRAQSGWSQRAKWVSTDARKGDWLGLPIAVQGEHVVVGAIGSAGPTVFANPQDGAVVIFSGFNRLFQSGFETP